METMDTATNYDTLEDRHSEYDSTESSRILCIVTWFDLNSLSLRWGRVFCTLTFCKQRSFWIWSTLSLLPSWGKCCCIQGKQQKRKSVFSAYLTESLKWSDGIVDTSSDISGGSNLFDFRRSTLMSRDTHDALWLSRHGQPCEYINLMGVELVWHNVLIIERL